MTGTAPRSGPLHVRFGGFELDEANALLLRGGSSIALSPTPFGLLCALARRPGALLTKHTLLDDVWGHRFVSDSVLKGAISDVRTALDDDPHEPRFIETVPRRGYRFIAVPAAVPGAPELAVGAALTRPAIQPSGQAPAAGSGSAVDAPHGSFVGRTRELASLRRAWEGLDTGKRVVFWIAGEPGIGKTSLIDQFVSGLRHATCARGNCMQHYGTGEPYHPVLEALAELCRIDESIPALLRDVAPTWLFQLPWLSNAEQRQALLRELVGVNLERMLREMGEFLDRYTERQPLLLVTEDLHWGDRATIQLIDYIARRRSKGRLMWLSSFRLAEVIASDHPLNSLRHELHLRGLCDEIVLDSFSEAEVAELMAHRSASMASDEGFVRALHERTDGVPLFVASVANDVAMRFTHADAATAALVSSAPVPETLSAIIEGYVTQLGNENRILLSAAAVCGAEFWIETLARVLGREDLSVADACEQLRREQLWLAPRPKNQDESRDAPYSFRHALFRQVLYDRLTPSARAELHCKVGAALEQRRAGSSAVTAAELAMHFDRGRMPLPALRYYSEAAQLALLHLSPAECMSLTERALTLLEHAPAGPERNSVEIGLATLHGVSAFHLLGAGDEARRAYWRGAALLPNAPRHPMRGLLLHGLGFLLNLRAEYAEALAIADRADALGSEAGDPFLALAACTTRGQAYMHQGRPDTSRAWLERALPVTETVDTSTEHAVIGFIVDPQVSALAMLSLPLVHIGRVREARERLRLAYQRARRIAQPMALLATIWYDALCAIRFGDPARVAALADEMRVLVAEFGLTQGESASRWFHAWADVRRGQPLEGFRQIRAAYEKNTSLGMISGGSETLGYAAEALVLHGDLDGAQEQLRQAFEIVNTYGERIYLPQLLLTEAAINRARGQPAEAEASIRRAVAESRAQGAPWLELLALTELCEEASAGVDDHRALGAFVTRLGEASDTPAFSRAESVLERARPN